MRAFVRNGSRVRAALWLFVVVLALAAGNVVSAQGADELMEQAEAAFVAKRTFGDGERAIGLFEQVIAADGTNAQAHIRIGELYYWLGELAPEGEKQPLLEKGLAFAQRAVELDDGHPEAHYWTGVLTGRIGEERGILQSLFMVKDIMAAVDRALELDPDHAGAHLLASQVYRKAPGWPLSIGDRKKAVEHGEEAVRLAPDKTVYVLNLAEAYLNNRQRDLARETLQRVIDMPLTEGEEVTSQMDKDRAAQLLADLKK